MNYVLKTQQVSYSKHSHRIYVFTDSPDEINYPSTLVFHFTVTRTQAQTWDVECKLLGYRQTVSKPEDAKRLCGQAVEGLYNFPDMHNIKVWREASGIVQMSGLYHKWSIQLSMWSGDLSRTPWRISATNGHQTFQAASESPTRLLWRIVNHIREQEAGYVA